MVDVAVRVEDVLAKAFGPAAAHSVELRGDEPAEAVDAVAGGAVELVELLAPGEVDGGGTERRPTGIDQRLACAVGRGKILGQRGQARVDVVRLRGAEALDQLRIRQDLGCDLAGGDSTKQRFGPAAGTGQGGGDLFLQPGRSRTQERHDCAPGLGLVRFRQGRRDFLHTGGAGLETGGQAPGVVRIVRQQRAEERSLRFAAETPVVERAQFGQGRRARERGDQLDGVEGAILHFARSDGRQGDDRGFNPAEGQPCIGRAGIAVDDLKLGGLALFAGREVPLHFPGDIVARRRHLTEHTAVGRLEDDLVHAFARLIRLPVVAAEKERQFGGQRERPAAKDPGQGFTAGRERADDAGGLAIDRFALLENPWDGRPGSVEGERLPVTRGTCESVDELAGKGAPPLGHCVRCRRAALAEADLDGLEERELHRRIGGELIAGEGGDGPGAGGVAVAGGVLEKRADFGGIGSQAGQLREDVAGGIGGRDGWKDVVD